MVSHNSPNGHEPSASIRRDYSSTDVERLAGSFRIRHTLAEMGAARLRHLLNTEPFVATLGALTGNQAVQQVKAGLKAIYVSGSATRAKNRISKPANYNRRSALCSKSWTKSAISKRSSGTASRFPNAS
jgi:isocitrate lyase